MLKKRLGQILQRSFKSKKTVLISFLIGISAGTFVYLILLQRYFVSLRYILYAFLIAVLTTFFTGWFIENKLKEKLSTYKPKEIFLIILFTAFFCIILLLNVKIEPLYPLTPLESLKIQIPGGYVDDEREVELLWIETGQGFLHYSNMQIDGEWERRNTIIYLKPDRDVTIQWQGHVGSWTEIAFRQTPDDQPVIVSWNGNPEEYNLNEPDDPIIYIRDSFPISFTNQMPFILTFFIAVGFVIFLSIVMLGAWHPEKKRNTGKRKWQWLLYMLPMLLVWIFTLLVFWPGIITNDSLAQWVQGVDNEFQDWHSAFHALLIALLMKLWYSPAIVVILQSVLFAFLVAWGLKILEDNGVPLFITWLISFLFALYPTNDLLSITIWKDVPYAISILWLSILLLLIFLSNGKWVEKKNRWLVLGVAGFFVAIFRQNGIAVAFISLILLPLFYKPQWKLYLRSVLLFSLLYAGVKGPLYNVVKVNREVGGQSNMILLHHIAAHWDAGTPFTSEEEAYLNSFMPLSEWDYSCCYMGTIYFKSGFDRSAFLDSSKENIDLALNLFLRDPLVDIRHMFCSGEIVWKYGNTQCYMKSTHGFNTIRTDYVDWIIPNDVNISEDSQLPDLVMPYIDYLRGFGFFSDRPVFYLTPAFYVYLLIYYCLVFALRSKNSKAWIVSFPILSQAGILLLINFVPAFRYLYSNLLVSTFFIGLLFIAPDEEMFNNKDY